MLPSKFNLFPAILITLLLISVLGCASQPAPPPIPTPTPTAQPTPTPSPTPEKVETKEIVIDGVMEEWPSTAIMISDSCGDVSDQAKSKNGADLKTVWALMEDDYLYMAIQLCDAFDPSLLRNYLIDLDFDKDKLPDYDFGVRPYDFEGKAAGQAWVLVFGLTGNKSDWFNENNWEVKEAYQVTAVGKLDTGILEIAIPREVYQMPDSILAMVRVTEGGPDVDFTKVFEVTLDKGK